MIMSVSDSILALVFLCVPVAFFLTPHLLIGLALVPTVFGRIWFFFFCRRSPTLALPPKTGSGTLGGGTCRVRLPDALFAVLLRVYRRASSL